MSEAMKAAASLYNDPRYYSKSEVRIRNNKVRRQRIFRRQLILLGFSVALVLFIVFFLLSSFLSGAQSDEYEPEFKYYKTITVHADETLWDIACTNINADHYSNVNAYMNEICNINSLRDSSSLNAGESLIIPYYSSEFK